MKVSLDAIRSCLEGAIPGVIATCSADGEPNVAYLSQVHYVDVEHVALSFQFFNKTRENVLANPWAMVQVIEPDTATQFRLRLHYLRTETEGPLFESMKAKLAGIASHVGMSKVFRLQGADIYRVLEVERVAATAIACPPPRRSGLAALRNCSGAMMGCSDLATLFDRVLLSIETHFNIQHAMLLIADEEGGRLITLGSRGYPASGVGSEIRLGEGVIGVAAQQRTPIRINYLSEEYRYGCSVRRYLEAESSHELENRIPFPGLDEAHSQMAVPILLDGRLMGVLFVESSHEMRFSYEEEDALATLAHQLAMAIALIGDESEATEGKSPVPRLESVADGPAVTVRHYPADDSVFLDQDYLIKGVAGAIFWRLMRDYTERGRTDFSNRELRLDPLIRLPDISANLETRLLLLQRRLAERCPYLRIEKTGRGRFRLDVRRPVVLEGLTRSA